MPALILNWNRPRFPQASKTSARAERMENGIKLFTPFDAEFVNLLKAATPYHSREWLWKESAWYVAEDSADTVLSLAAMFWPDLKTT